MNLKYKNILGRNKRAIVNLFANEKQTHTTVEIFLLRKDARTRQRYSVGVGKEDLPFLGTGLLCPLTAIEIKMISKRGKNCIEIKKIYINVYWISFFSCQTYVILKKANVFSNKIIET